ncbi:MAG: outer membrane protein transport protein [Verrucomicrobia bacterium]|nr:outer membrane protein transport protein [Verrucomicrobiota bacterium]
MSLSKSTATPLLPITSPSFRLADQDADATARGLAFAATADNPSAIYYNPAGITQLDGTRILTGSYAISFREKVTPAPAGSTSFTNTNQEFQLAPHLFITTKAKNSPFAFGLGIYSPYGLSVEYPDNTPFRTTARQGKIIYVAINPVVAWKIHQSLSLAAGPSFNYGSAELQQGVFTLGDQFRFKGDGLSFNFSAGLKWDPHHMHHFGVAYHSATTINFTGQTNLQTNAFTVPTPNGPFRVPPINRNQDASARFSIPQNIVFGYSFTPTPDWNFEFNADWTDWNQLNTVTLHQQHSPNVALPFNWNSSWLYEFGITKKFAHQWQASIGYIWSENSVPTDQFNPVIPDSNRHVLSAGIGKKFDHFSWNIAYQWSYGLTRTITQDTTANGTYQAQGNALNFTLGYHF